MSADIGLAARNNRKLSPTSRSFKVDPDGSR